MIVSLDPISEILLSTVLYHSVIFCNSILLYLFMFHSHGLCRGLDCERFACDGLVIYMCLVYSKVTEVRVKFHLGKPV